MIYEEKEEGWVVRKLGGFTLKVEHIIMKQRTGLYSMLSRIL